MRTETEAFLDTMLPRQTEMMRAFHAGDVGPRLALGSHRDPVTFFGA